MNQTTNTPTVLVVFGATGDLMSRKIVPSLFHLFENGQLPKMCSVVGFSRQNLSDLQFQQLVKQALTKHSKGKKDIPESFLNRFHYQPGYFQRNEGYLQLGKRLGHIDRHAHACANKLFYIAVPPQFYQTIFKHLNEMGLTETCSPRGEAGGPNESGWTRVLVEKPFGSNLSSAQKLDHLLRKFFSEDQIYRIDHYLAKEMIQGIINFRFSNKLFEPQWNNHSIERIDIRLLETIGVEDRGGFYDKVGALRDVGQNHLLQMLALVTMDNPKTTQAADIRAKRADILNYLLPLKTQELMEKTFRAQYQGYRAIAGVKPHSQTETYFKFETRLDHPRWHNVPITLEGGKRLSEVRKEIVVTFKHPNPCLLCAPGKHFQNKVVFTVEPQETITIHFWAKKPGFREIESRHFTFFLYEKRQKLQYVEEYSKLLLDAMAGDQTLFVSSDEVEAMWRFIDPIIEGWRRKLVPLDSYRPGEDTILEKADQAFAKQLLVKPSLPRQIAIVGLGKMGDNFAVQLLQKGWQVEGYDTSSHELKTASSLQELVGKLRSPRIIWLMVPSGKPVDETIDRLVPLLAKGDIVIDGGNSFYKDTIERFKRLKRLGVHFVDVGVSGGPQGARAGASLMVGGQKEVYEKLFDLFSDLAVPEGVQFFETAGAGHFVKMVHNGIEYGMMQAIAEGFTILKNAQYKLDLSAVAEIYNHGSVIESRLIGWLKDAFDLHGQSLKDVTGKVEHTGEGAWTVEEAKALKIQAKVIEEALKFRIQSQRHPSYTGKILTALREQFGGHSVN